MLGSGSCITGGSAEPLPEDPDHDIGLVDLHPLIDQSLRALQVQARPSASLPSQRQQTVLRRTETAVDLLHHVGDSRALRRHVPGRDQHHLDPLDNMIWRHSERLQYLRRKPLVASWPRPYGFQAR
jgi:hypothetical protein